MKKILYTILLLFISAPVVLFANENDRLLVVTQPILQKVGDNLLVSFKVRVDRDVEPNESIVLTPKIEDIGQQNLIKLPNIYINSRKQHIMYLRDFYIKDENTAAIRRINGSIQTVEYLQSIPYKEWMDSAKLELEEVSCGCGIPFENGSSHIANIVRIPEELPALAYARPMVEERKVRYEKGSAFIEFPLDDIVIYSDFRNNSRELNKIVKSIEYVMSDDNIILDSISLHGYASPEGPYNNNVRLSIGRTKAVKDYINNKYNFNNSIFTTSNTPEDWEGFEALLSDTTFKDKKKIVGIIEDANLSLDAREASLRKNYNKFFTDLIDGWFKVLRRTDYIITYDVKPFSLEQSREMFVKKPSDMSLEEMYILANSYMVGSDDYNNVFLTAVRIFPDDPVANLNAACISLSKKDLNSAEFYLSKALECPEKDLANGVLYMLKGKYDKAQSYIQKAKIAGLLKRMTI